MYTEQGLCYGLSVRLSHHLYAAAAARFRLSIQRAGDVDRLLHSAPAGRRSAANVVSATLTR